MGFKTVKDYYQIGHIVQVCEGNICIGSQYVHNIIVLSPEGEIIRIWERDSSNPDLRRYEQELSRDAATGKLRELIAAEDKFDNLIPVWTVEKGRVVQKFCEQRGWPNCTTEGEIMFVNQFFDDYAAAKKHARDTTAYGVKSYGLRWWEVVKESGGNLSKWTGFLLREVRAYLVARIFN